MKMVSQLTKQAMSRHRLISAAPYPPSPVSPPSAQPSQNQPTRTLYSAPILTHAVDAPTQPPAQSFSVSSPPAPLAPMQSQHTIYGQLMKKHDRFTERHIVRS